MKKMRIVVAIPRRRVGDEDVVVDVENGVVGQDVGAD